MGGFVGLAREELHYSLRQDRSLGTRSLAQKVQSVDAHVSQPLQVLRHKLGVGDHSVFSRASACQQLHYVSSHKTM
eukprot:scaffold1639_cov331-Pavlova_lutheri.AAC.19